MASIEEVKKIIIDTLNLNESTSRIDSNTPLVGNIPELDSMAVIALITRLEDHFGFAVDDDEISADNFETIGTLAAFVDAKLIG